jgi:hypothetical protein
MFQNSESTSEDLFASVIDSTVTRTRVLALGSISSQYHLENSFMTQPEWSTLKCHKLELLGFPSNIKLA